MAAGEGDLERPPRLEPGRGPRRGPGPADGRAGRDGGRDSARVGAAAGAIVTRGIATGAPGATGGRGPRRPPRPACATPMTSTPVDEARLVDRGVGDDDPPRPAAGRAPRPSAGCPGTGRDLAAERQLADERAAARSGADLLRPEQDAEGHRQVERGAGLAQVRRGEVDRDAPRREHEAGVADRAADPFAGLLDGRVGQADDREPGQARGDVDLDADEPAIEAVERGGRRRQRACAPPLPAAAHPALIGGSPGDHRPCTAATGLSRAATAAATAAGLSTARAKWSSDCCPAPSRPW